MVHHCNNENSDSINRKAKLALSKPFDDSTHESNFTLDNSDYQWFFDYGCREPTLSTYTNSISPLETSCYRTNNVQGNFRNMDANVADIDIENFKTEDIFALLCSIPSMINDKISHEDICHGESFASITKSILDKIDFDHSFATSSQNDSNSLLSLSQSEILFSPMKEVPLPDNVSCSIDSLDSDILMTCQANKQNYTIAFEASLMNSLDDNIAEKEFNLSTSTVSNHENSPASNLVTWQTINSNHSTTTSKHIVLRHYGSKSSDCIKQMQTSAADTDDKCKSLPNVFNTKDELSLTTEHQHMLNLQDCNDSSERHPCSSNDNLELLHQAKRQNGNNSTTHSTSSQELANSTLIKLYLNQKQTTANLINLESLSLEEQTSNHRHSRSKLPTENLACTRNTFTSHSNGSIDCENNNNFINKSTQTLDGCSTSSSDAGSAPPQDCYVFYPNYGLPDLEFLQEMQNDATFENQMPNFHFVPQRITRLTQATIRSRPYSCNDIEELYRRKFTHIEHWDSLMFLLPEFFKAFINGIGVVNKTQNSVSSTNVPPTCGSAVNSQCCHCAYHDTGKVGIQHGVKVARAHLNQKCTDAGEAGDIITSMRAPNSTNINDQNHNIQVHDWEEFYVYLNSISVSDELDSSIASTNVELSQCVQQFCKLGIAKCQQVDSFDIKKLSKLCNFCCAGVDEKNCTHYPRPTKNKSTHREQQTNIQKSTATDVGNSPRNKKDSQNLYTKKRNLVNIVSERVDQIVLPFALRNGDPVKLHGYMNTISSLSQLVLSRLCPVLYLTLADGLKSSPHHQQPTDVIWQIILATTEANAAMPHLNGLVQYINEAFGNAIVLTKFNAFMFGLLNDRSMDVWWTYMRARIDIITRYYKKKAFLRLAHTDHYISTLLDVFITNLQSLTFLPADIELSYDILTSI